MKTVPELLVVLVAAFSCAQAAKYTHFEDRDCPGNDIDSFTGSSVSSCKKKCNSRQNCKSFQLNTDNVCYLKDKVCNHEELSHGSNGNIYQKESSLIHWLRDIDDDNKLQYLAIPGAHEAGAYRLNDDDAECQDWDIQQQISGGIRFFDIRISNGGGDNDFEVKHGSLNLGSFRTKVMDVVANFLRQFPHETIFMSIKPENSFDISRMENLFVKNSDYLFYQDAVNGNTKLGEVRGKIVLIKRYSATSYSSSVGIQWDQLEVQAEYQLDANYLGVGFHLKAEAVTDHLEAAAVSYNDKIWVNVVSANWNGLYNERNAEVSNAAVKEFYEETDQRVGSIVVMDYPNRSSGVIEAIIDNNQKQIVEVAQPTLEELLQLQLEALLAG